MQSSCNKCLYDKTHPFGISLSQTGCSGCITHDEKNSIDWEFKYDSLRTLVNQKKRAKRSYDCVVPVVGDAEDYYTLLNVLKLGLSPLVVCVNDYFKNDIGWYNLHNLITHFDVDSFVYNPDIRVYKDLVRTSLRKFDHVMLPFLSLHSSFPVHIAQERNIPFVIWGQHQAVEQVGKFSHYDEVEMSSWSRTQHDLFETNIGKLIGNGAQVDIRALNYYTYPDICNLTKSGVRGIYLSNYLRWDPLKQNQDMLTHGFKAQQNNSSFDIYERAGSSVYYQFHDLLKLKRLGYRKVTDQLVREIRHGRITKQEALILEEQYSKNKVSIRPFFDWLDVTNSGYEWFLKHRLGNVSNLISEDHNIIQPKIELPHRLETMIGKSTLSKKDHVIFGKGISI